MELSKLHAYLAFVLPFCLEATMIPELKCCYFTTSKSTYQHSRPKDGFERPICEEKTKAKEWCFYCQSDTCKIMDIPMEKHKTSGITFRHWPKEIKVEPGCHDYNSKFGTLSLLFGHICFCNHKSFCNLELWASDYTNSQTGSYAISRSFVDDFYRYIRPTRNNEGEDSSSSNYQETSLNFKNCALKQPNKTLTFLITNLLIFLVLILMI